MRYLDEIAVGTKLTQREQTEGRATETSGRIDRGQEFRPETDPDLRLDFWVDTCRDIREMRISSARIIDLYRQHGCRFYAPSKLQAESVLSALDGALPQWEREHPELFYQTLELNFPDLLRRRF